MTWAQKLAAWLLGWDYVALIGDSLTVARAEKIGNYWVAQGRWILRYTGGVMFHEHLTCWEPLTPRIARFYSPKVL